MSGDDEILERELRDAGKTRPLMFRRARTSAAATAGHNSDITNYVIARECD